MSDVKVIDLDLPADLDPAVAVFWGQAQSANEQLKKEIAEMSLEQLDYRGPNSDLNSTAMLLNHLCTAELFFFYRRLQGKEYPEHWQKELVFQTGKTLPLVNGVPAARWAERLDRVRQESRAYLATLTAADLVRTLPAAGRPTAPTVRWVLWHWADHIMLHLGQIRTLRTLGGMRGE